MALSRRKIGLLGGSFDPVHRAHIALAEAAYQQLELDEVLLIPAATPWQRAPLQASEQHRLAMLERACATRPWLRASPVELERGGPTYTIDTLRALPARHDYYWLLGSDQLANFCSWQDWQEIIRHVTLVVAPRSHAQPDAPHCLSKALQAQGRSLITLAFPPMSLSATAIRNGLAQGQDMSGLLEPAVADYIHEHGLYRTEQDITR